LTVRFGYSAARAPLAYIRDNASVLRVITTAATRYAETTGASNNQCVSANVSAADFTIASGSTGPVLTVATKRDQLIKGNGLATHIALTRNSATSLLLLTNCSSQTLASGHFVDIASWTAINAQAGELLPSLEVAPDIDPVSVWEVEFQADWANELSFALPLSTSGDAYKHYQLAYAGLDANVSMWRATGNLAYLNRALTYVNNMIATAIPANTIPQNVYSDTYLGWPTLTAGYSDTREQLLEQVFPWRHVATLLRAMRNVPSVYGDTSPGGYREQYDDILSFTEVNILDKWRSRGNSRLYHGTVHIDSHTALIALAVKQLSTNSTYVTNATTILNNITVSGLPSGAPVGVGESINSALGKRVNPYDALSWWWAYDYSNTTANVSDSSHGAAVAEYMVECFGGGYFWTQAQVQKMVRTHYVIILKDDAVAPFTYYNYVDGTGTGDGWLNNGWVKLGRYDVATQQRMEIHPLYRNTTFLGNGALNAAFLLGTEVA
jgi:hypothetical protein